MNKTAALEWEADVRLVTHPLMLATFAKLFVITGLLMGALLSFLLLMTGEPEGIVPLLEMVGLVDAGLAVVCLLIALVVFRNRMRMRFRVDAKAAGVEMIDRRAAAANKVAIVAGVLGGKPGVAGAGLLAASNTQQKTVWGAVAKARYYPAWNAITLSNGWRVIVTLYCTAENYAAVAAAVEHAMAARPADSKKPRKSPLPRLLLHTALIVLATVPLFGLPDLDDEALLPAILVLAFAQASLWLIPVLAWAVFAGLAWLALIEFAAQNEMRTSYFDGSQYQAWEVMGDNDYALLAAAALGAAYLIWLSLGLLRGRIRAGLVGDMAEMDGEEA